jgi:hypothetical protein
MKSTGIFVGALIGLSVLVSGAMLVTATMKPEWFTFGVKQHADTASARSKKDSLAARDTSLVPHGTDAASAAADSSSLTSRVASQPVPEKNVPTVMQQGSSVLSASAKEDDLQNLVKLYEAMKPEDAAKILGKMNDKEIRTIILHSKKKQAAKILSYFDASRAAQILAQ